ncbi:MAG: choice-of-anchor Q domain-containing protein [Dokdonella sp.]|uniref:choice-of-anchor Q domain-containing protein n=1 Tax=Dokdonella sp. TaxID=2291710 RepID=UPI003F7FB297
MFDSISRVHASARRTPLGIGLAAALCLGTAMPAAAATTWTVDTCDEAATGSGTTGSLRYAAANAAAGDTIDMTALACSTISLTTGAVLLAQDDITLKGPGREALTVSGDNDCVFRHTGHGAFNLEDLTAANGYVHPSVGAEANGGCIASNGKAYLTRVGVRACRVSAVGASAHGGGVYARELVFAKYSDISGNVATSSGSGTVGDGGGIFSYHDIFLGNSTVSGNSAAAGDGGGARALLGDATIVASTISGNIARRGGGIVQLYYASNAQSFALLDSTVSGNSATDRVGGVLTNAGTIDVKNSTVAFNTAGTATGSSTHYAPGFAVSDAGAYYTDINHYGFKVVTLQSSVFSNNAYGTPPTSADDLGVAHFSSINLVPISGQANLVFATELLGLQNTMTTGVCPQLGPLRDNGGPTQTHALWWSSPAIDQGNNTVPFAVDQRGAPFARVSGAAADIGAYEVQQGDVVFVDGFDDPPTCSGG